MLELRPLHGNIRGLHHSGLQLCSGLSDIGFWSGTSFKSIYGELEGILVSLHRVVQKLLLCVSAAQLEIVEGELGVKAQTDRFEVSGCRLSLLTRSGNSPAHPSP